MIIICMKSSIKYLIIVCKIMDSINDKKFELLNNEIKNLRNTE
jgi:hypothetical protein